MVNLILILSFLWILPFITATMWWQEKQGNNLVLGVRVPDGWQNAPEFLAVRKQYKQWLIAITICLLPIPFLGFLIPYDSIILTMDMAWLLCVMGITFYAYVRGYKKVKELKCQKAYAAAGGKKILVDTKTAEVPRKMAHASFAVATVLSFIPCFLSAIRAGVVSRLVMLTLTGTVALTTPLIWLLCYMLMSAKVEVLSANSTVNENFARMKRRTWNLCMQWCAWMNTAFVLFVYFAMLRDAGTILRANRTMEIIIVSMVYAVAMTVALLRAIGKVNRIRVRVLEREKDSNQEEDDDFWIWGAFYYNPNDRHTMIEKRFGIGTTVNLATGVGKLFAVIGALGMILPVILCVWLIFEEFTPVAITLSEASGTQTVQASHTRNVYEVDLSEVTDAKLLEELPKHGKIAGTNMTCLEKGTFEAEGIGVCEMCLNPKKGPFLVLETEKKIYIFSDADAEVTRQVYRESHRVVK